MGSACCTKEEVDQNTLDDMERRRYHSSSSEDDDPNVNESSEEPVVVTNEDANNRIIRGYKEAIVSGNDSLAVLLVEDNPELQLMQLKFENGDSCLHTAIKNERHAIAVYLLDSGAEVNEVNMKTGDTPLHYACRTRNLKLAMLLYKHEADPFFCNYGENEESPLTISAGFKDMDIIQVLQPNYRAMMLEEDRGVDIHAIKDAGMIAADGYHHAAHEILKAHIPDLNTRGSAILDVIDFGDESDDSGYDNEDITETADDYQLRSMDADDILGGNGNSNHKSDAGHHEAQHSANIKQMDDLLDDDEKRHFESIRIANINPFSKLANTKRALQTMQKIANKKSKLPVLEAWLQKKKTTPPYSWQKRWVIVRENYILWSDKQKEIKDSGSMRERSKFNGSLNLLILESVHVYKSKSERKFMIEAKQAKKKKLKKYLYKAASKRDRDYWIRGLREHKAHMSYMLNFLGTK